MPGLFEVKKDGPWFDTFLVRHRIDPAYVFHGDPSIKLQRHEGTWWLYRRGEEAATATPALPK
jgi:hypothetical protein